MAPVDGLTRVGEHDVCRVCGLSQPQPWGPDGTLPSFDICECCGTEFGYEDGMPDAARRARQRWLDAGAPWFDPRERPDGWDLDRQLANVPPAWR